MVESENICWSIDFFIEEVGAADDRAGDDEDDIDLLVIVFNGN